MSLPLTNAVSALVQRYEQTPTLPPEWDYIVEALGDAEFGRFGGIDPEALADFRQSIIDCDLEAVRSFVMDEVGFACAQCGENEIGMDPTEEVCRNCEIARDEADEARQEAHERQHAARFWL